MAMRSDTHTHTHAMGPHMSTGACSDSMFFSSWSFFFFFLHHPTYPASHSSTEDGEHQQPDIISIGEDKECPLMTTNIYVVDFCACN